MHDWNIKKIYQTWQLRGGALIDFIEFVYTAGEPLSVGEGKGEEQEAFDLEPGEAETGRA
jgi:hypothetical protein